MTLLYLWTRALTFLPVVATLLPGLFAQSPVARFDTKLNSSVVALSVKGEGGEEKFVEYGFFVRPNLIATAYGPIKQVKDLSRIRVKMSGGDKFTAVASAFMIDEQADIALLRTESAIGKPLPLNRETLTLGHRVSMVVGLDKGGVELIEEDLFGAGKVNDRCYIEVYKLPKRAVGGPVINARGEVIAILVDPPAPTTHTSYAASILIIAQMIGEQHKDVPVAGGVSGGVPGGVPAFTHPKDCVEALLGPQPPPPPPPPPPTEGKSALPKVIRKSGGVLAGEALARPEPEYPQAAVEARVSGPVVVEITIDESGNVISARALSGHPLLRDAAIDAARRWKFKRTQLSGIPVKVIGTITFNFNL
jgi:TonB family protein